MDVVVAGATGFIGAPLCRALAARGHGVTALVRDAARARGRLPESAALVSWSDRARIEGVVAQADAVVNLAGASLAGRRWSDAYQQELRDSRIRPTAALAEAVARAGGAGKALLNASAVGYYGDTGDVTVMEQSPPGTDFLARLCVDWEAAAEPARQAGARVALLRTGVVLGEGGALAQMLPPFRLGLGGPLGSGRQWLPWVHLADAVGMVVWALEEPDARGPLNVTSPNPVRMRDFAAALGRVLRRPAVLPVPAFALRLLLGEFAGALLGGQRALPDAARRLGYRWQFPDLEPALRSLLTAG